MRSILFALQLGIASLPWLAAWPPPVQAEEIATTLERRVKAAFVFKFAAYVEWPDGTFADAASPLVIASAGDSELTAELAEIAAGRSVEGHPVRVRKVAPGELPPADAHVVFVGRADIARISALINATRNRPQLIVTDLPNALPAGSVINFMLADGRVRFEIAYDEAERRRLKLSSRLLAVAQNVRKAP